MRKISRAQLRSSLYVAGKISHRIFTSMFLKDSFYKNKQVYSHRRAQFCTGVETWHVLIVGGVQNFCENV